jgi:hypothetical protein
LHGLIALKQFSMETPYVPEQSVQEIYGKVFIVEECARLICITEFMQG